MSMHASAIKLVFWLALVIVLPVLHGKVCRPSCTPPADEGCRVYHRVDRCRTSMKMPEALCGCAWKSFIWRADRVSRLIFTVKGRTCYEWAALACEAVPPDIQAMVKDALEASSKQSSKAESAADIIYDMQRRLDRLEKGNIISDTDTNVVTGKNSKHVRSDVVRTGEVYGKLETHHNRQRLIAVERLEDAKNKGNYWGKIYKDPSSQWFEIKHGGKNGSTGSSKDAGWFNWDNDQFKLMIFGLIILFNIFCIIIAMVCKCDQKMESKETKKAGDLDPSMYTSNQNNLAHNKQSHLENFIEKLRLYHRKKAKKNLLMPQVELTEFEPTKYFKIKEKPIQIYTTTPKSKRKSSYTPLVNDDSHYYENLPGPSKQDMTYEQPMVRDRSDTMPRFDSHTLRYSHESFSDGDLSASPQFSAPSPTIEVTGKRDPEGKQVSFVIPSGIDNRERVEPNKADEDEERRPDVSNRTPDN